MRFAWSSFPSVSPVQLMVGSVIGFVALAALAAAQGEPRPAATFHRDQVSFQVRTLGEGAASANDDATAPRALSPALEILQTAYAFAQYSTVRNSLLQRGYDAFNVPDPIAERCMPTAEGLCQRFPEAVCNQRGMLGILCTFVFHRSGTRELLGVAAVVNDFGAYAADVQVLQLRELGNEP